MKLLLTVFFALSAAQPDCDPFKKECQARCIAHSNGVSTNQCWGSPRYRLCKCSDSTVLDIPGWSCDHPTCPGGGSGARVSGGVAVTAPAVAQTQPAPTPKPTPAPLCSFCGDQGAVSGLSAWEVGKSSDGTQVTTIGSNVVVCAEHHHYAYASFSMAEPGKSYATLDVAVKNRAEAANGLVLSKYGEYAADLSAANGIVLTYQSSAPMYLQIRHAGNKHGGHHYRILLPAHPTMATANLPFSSFAQPSWAATTYPLDLKDVFSFTFVATQDGAVLVQSLLLSSATGQQPWPAPAACTVREAACPWEQGNRCMAARPAIGGSDDAGDAYATQPVSMNSRDVIAHVETAAREAVRLQNERMNTRYTFHSVLSGGEQRVQGYNYPLRLTVGTPAGGTATVDAVVATTTYRDTYRLLSWDLVSTQPSAATQPSTGGGDVYAAQPSTGGGDVYATQPSTGGGDVYATQPSTGGGDVYATQPTSTKWGNAAGGGGDVYATQPRPAAVPVSAGGVAGRAQGTVITPQGDARAVYNTPYKARGQMFPFITEDGECVDISPPWPKGYMPCCPGCHSRPCQSCFRQPSGHYVPM